MNRCEQIRALTALYLDDELRGRERDEFEAHLRDCAACRAQCENERRFLSAVRDAGPLATPDAGLQARVERLFEASTRRADAPPLRPRTVSIAIAASLIIALGALYLAGSRRGTSTAPSEFALMAVEAHLRHARGGLPLEIRSDSPQQITAWLNAKVPFSVKLPDYQGSAGEEKLYQLEGARLVGFRHDDAAYVSYRMGRHPISLVVTSDAAAAPGGGEEIVAKGRRFHYVSLSGLKVITWADHGLSYALVSDLEERGQQSCLVCHTGAGDRDFIEQLRPAARSQ